VKVFGEQEYLKSDSPKIPSSVYGKSKLLAEQFIEQNLAKEHTYHILEPVMIYGKGNKGNLPKLYNVLMKGLPYPFSGWQNKRSLLAIENLQFVFNKLIEQKCASGSFMVCDDEPISTYDMLKCICKGNKRDFIHFSLPPFFVRFLMSATRMLGMQFLDKVLGTLVCDNTALKDNIGIELMPFSTKERLQKLDFTS
jgi:nucleoside-diphosphate-sugar epimerase